MQQSSFSDDGSRQSLTFGCKQSTTAEVDSMFHGAGTLDFDVSIPSKLSFTQEIVPGCVHSKSMLTWMGMNPFDCGNCLDPDNMPHDSHQILYKSWSKPLRGVGEFINWSNTFSFTHKQADVRDSRLYEHLRKSYSCGSPRCSLRPSSRWRVDPACRTCDMRTCPRHNQQNCQACSSTVHAVCASIKL